MSAPLHLRAVLFDLDGTLADTAPDLIAAVNRILAEEGRAPLPDAALRPLVSKGGRALLACAFADLGPEAREPLLPRFLDAYAQALAVHTRPFDGVEGLLAAIEARGWPWGIVTNKPEGLAVGVVEGLGWSTRSKALVGGDTLTVRKPAPEPLWLAAERLGVAPADCLYVGDDARDIEAAKAAGMPSAAALWGYREAHENPAEWAADVVCADADALRAWLSGSMRPRGAEPMASLTPETPKTPATPVTSTSDDAGVAAFFAKAEAREPGLRPAVGFVPPESRAAFRAWTGLLTELRECAFELSDPRVTAVKAGWWAEELDGVARGAARHPLTRALVRFGGPWRGIGESLVAVAGDLDPKPDPDAALAALHPLAARLIAVERHLAVGGGLGVDPAVVDVQATSLAVHWLRVRLDVGLSAPDRARVPLTLFARHALRREQLVEDIAEPLRRDWAAALLARLPRTDGTVGWPYSRRLAVEADRRCLVLRAAGRASDAAPGGFLWVWRAWRLARNAALPFGAGDAPPA